MQGLLCFATLTEGRKVGSPLSLPFSAHVFCPPPQQTRGEHRMAVERQLLHWQGHGAETQVSVGVLVVCFELLLQPPMFVLSFSGHRK